MSEHRAIRASEDIRLAIRQVLSDELCPTRPMPRLVLTQELRVPPLEHQLAPLRLGQPLSAPKDLSEHLTEISQLLGRGDEGMARASILRSLIRDILHDELQGDMGERVTRNLRQIIRHEVAQALADKRA